jgi:anhydro-N-acetylmuramic acid kinase
VDEAVLTAMLDHPYFAAPSPKSLDRNDFTIQPARGLSAADGAATLTAFTAATVAEALDQLPARPKRLIVAGGGRHNPTLLRMIGGLLAPTAGSMPYGPDAMYAYVKARSASGERRAAPATAGGGDISRPRAA